MAYIDLDALIACPLQTDPFEFVIVPNFVRSERLGEVIADFPRVPGPGSHPPSELKIQGDFADLMAELHDAGFRRAIEAKFGVDLSDRPTMYTVRGYTRAKDGGVHTDSKTKIITVLLYLNESWESDSGRLRLLRSKDLDDCAVEVPPTGGTLLVFKRSCTSWHGHKPFEGRRRAIQFNWVTTQDVVDKEQARHRLSTRIKKVKHFFFPIAA